MDGVQFMDNVQFMDCVQDNCNLQFHKYPHFHHHHSLLKVLWYPLALHTVYKKIRRQKNTYTHGLLPDRLIFPLSKHFR